jgi:hypothetical protein
LAGKYNRVTGQEARVGLLKDDAMYVEQCVCPDGPGIRSQHQAKSRSGAAVVQRGVRRIAPLLHAFVGRSGARYGQVKDCEVLCTGLCDEETTHVERYPNSFIGRRPSGRDGELFPGSRRGACRLHRAVQRRELLDRADQKGSLPRPQRCPAMVRRYGDRRCCGRYPCSERDYSSAGARPIYPGNAASG